VLLGTDGDRAVLPASMLEPLQSLVLEVRQPHTLGISKCFCSATERRQTTPV